MSQTQVVQPFYTWISDVFINISEDVIAFVFNIYEEDDVYLVDITGTIEFNNDNEEWTESIGWDSGEELFIIPKDNFDGDWEDIHDLIAQALEDLIDEDNELANDLCDSEAIAVGFIDGDLEFVWQE